MSAPAVPTSATQVAPTTKIDSTAEAPHGQSVSSIGNGGPPPAEAPMHTGMYNCIDPYYYTQFLALASFIWSTSQNAGTLLWSTKISPKALHRNIKNISKGYNVYSGGVTFNAKVCGTGFHSGAIIFARLPPNVPPESLKTLQEITMFEYVMIDPKTLEVVSHHVIDQRRMMYHYMNDEGVDSFGGYFAAYVYAPLNTSSTGATNISIQILSRLAPDFMFSQVVPVPDEVTTIGEKTGVDDIAQALSLAASCNAMATATRKEPITNLFIEPATVTTPVAANTGGCYNFRGERLDKEQTFEFPYSPYIMRNNLSSSNVELEPEGLKDFPSGKGKMSFAAKTTNARNIYVVDTDLAMPASGRFTVTTASSLEDRTEAYAKKDAMINIHQWVASKRNVPSKLSNESFVTFSNDDKGLNKSFQTYTLASLLKEGGFKELMRPTDAAIFDLIDTEDEVPVYRMKLSYNGTLTTKGVANQIMLPAKKYAFKFVQFTKATEPIPAPPVEQQMLAKLTNIAFTASKQQETILQWQQSQHSSEETSSLA